jgi:hypothetical protein
VRNDGYSCNTLALFGVVRDSSAVRQLTTLVVIGTDCTCSCKSNYHTITMEFIVMFSKVYSEHCHILVFYVIFVTLTCQRSIIMIYWWFITQVPVDRTPIWYPMSWYRPPILWCLESYNYVFLVWNHVVPLINKTKVTYLLPIYTSVQNFTWNNKKYRELRTKSPGN